MTDGENHKRRGVDAYLIGEWVIVDRRTVGTSLFRAKDVAAWMRTWRDDVVLSIVATLYHPAGTPLEDVVAAYEWHINADGVRDAA